MTDTFFKNLTAWIVINRETGRAVRGGPFVYGLPNKLYVSADQDEAIAMAKEVQEDVEYPVGIKKIVIKVFR